MESHGALVGWGHCFNRNRLMLRLESFRSKDALDRGDFDAFSVLMTKRQALLLGHYLTKHSGQSSVEQRESGWFRRRFG